MKVVNKLFAVALCGAAVLSLVMFAGCKNSSSDSPATSDPNVIIDGASDDDGSKTATFVDGELKVDPADSMKYVFSGLAGVGKFEVKSSASSWANITADTMSVLSAGSDKIAKIKLELTGSTPQQAEVAYNIGTAKDISGKSVSFKIYIPAVYAETGASAYPMIALWTKTSSWTATKFAEFNTLNIGSGWKTITVDFAAKTFSVDGTALTPTTGETLAFSDANLAKLTDTQLVVIGFYGSSLPSTMTGEFYLDWFNISGMSTPVLAAPVISQDINNVSITEATSGATIYYTKNGTDPTTSSPVYSGPFAIASNTTVKAFAVLDGYTNSPISTKACTYTAGDTTTDATDVDFKFSSDASAVNADGDDSTFGTAGSRFDWALEETGKADGILVVKGVSTAPTAYQKTSIQLNLASPAASPSKIVVRIKVPSAYLNDWWTSMTVNAKIGDAWTYTSMLEAKRVKFADSANGFAADTWKTIEFAPADFTGGSISDLRALVIQFDRSFAADTSQATAIGDIQIDYVDVQ